MVKESADGVTWSKNNVWEKGNSNSGSVEVQLNPTTRYLRFCYSGNLSATINNIVVTEKKQFEASPNPLDFGPQGVDYGIQDKEVTFLHANAGRLTTAVIEGADKKNFSVDPMNIPGTGRDLHGTAVLKVYFNNYDEVRGEEPYNAVLVISDNSKFFISSNSFLIIETVKNKYFL